MLTSKQISYLRSLSVNEPDVIQIGKDGVTPQVVIQTEQAIKARELIKGKVLNNSLETARSAAETLAAAIRCEVVCTIGNKFILYKRHNKDPKIVLPKTAKKK